MTGKRIFSDIDNTLIFSHRYTIGERSLVECLNGKEQAFMTKSGYELLQKISLEEFVPVTSRTKAQYQRIHFFSNGDQPKCALIDNGGILLVDGSIDTEWIAETNGIIAEDMESVRRFESLFSKRADMKWQDGMVLFLKTDIPFEEIKVGAHELGLMALHHFNKIYVCSKYLSKGYAVRRFKKRFPTEYTIVAGDSEADVSMVSEADEAFLALELQEYVVHTKYIHFMDALSIAEKLFGI